MNTAASIDALPDDLTALGALIARHLREHFPADAEQDRQALALAEEAGEIVGAYRRASGMARRNGPWEEVKAELADVAITAYVTAFVCGIDPTKETPTSAFTTTDPHKAVMHVFAAAGWFVDAYADGRTSFTGPAMADVVAATRHAASVLEIDLAAAIRTKARKIVTRGWRDTVPPDQARSGA